MEEQTRLSAEEKQLIKQELGIDTDGELLSPVVDFVFKLLFTSDEDSSKKALIDFVSCILVAEGDNEITDLTVTLPQPPTPNEQKKSIFDIRAKYNDGEQVIIEMQNLSLPDFKKRSQYLISRAYVS